ncbi:putative transcription factor interactor and regulator CCHC(Zn) family [Helianthus anomalus]
MCVFASESRLGFNKSKVTCFKYRRKGHFKRECTGQESQDNINPFSRLQVDVGSSMSRNKALVVIHEDEGFNWNNIFLNLTDKQWLPRLLKSLRSQLMKKTVVFIKFLLVLKFLIR